MPRSTKRLRLAATAAFAAASLPACAGSSSERWDALRAPEDFRRWKVCIEDYSEKWWTRHFLGEVSDPEVAAMPRYTQDQAFAAILALCRVHAATPLWTSLPASRHRRMLRDARARFDRIRTQVWAAAFESII
jgi:hypothetical protein